MSHRTVRHSVRRAARRTVRHAVHRADRRRVTWRTVTRSIGIAVAVVALPLASAACVGSERAPQVQTAPLGADEVATYEYVIPYGTGVKINAGQSVDLMPTTLDARVGESIRIVNRDDEDFMVGPFFVKARATVAMRFTREGRLVGTCDMNASGEIVINVTA